MIILKITNTFINQIISKIFGPLAGSLDFRCLRHRGFAKTMLYTFFIIIDVLNLPNSLKIIWMSSFILWKHPYHHMFDIDVYNYIEHGMIQIHFLGIFICIPEGYQHVGVLSINNHLESFEMIQIWSYWKLLTLSLIKSYPKFSAP